MSGVTHWHLVRTEWRLNDPQRWDADRVATARHRPAASIARTPEEVVAWLQREAPRDSLGIELALAFATRGQDCHRLHRLGTRRIAHLDAYGMTAAQCRCDTNDRGTR